MKHLLSIKNNWMLSEIYGDTSMKSKLGICIDENSKQVDRWRNSPLSYAITMPAPKWRSWATLATQKVNETSPRIHPAKCLSRCPLPKRQGGRSSLQTLQEKRREPTPTAFSVAPVSMIANALPFDASSSHSAVRTFRWTS